MVQHEAGRSQTETWTAPEKNESKRSKNRRKHKQAKRQKRSSATTRVESDHEFEPAGLREYRAEELSEAVIWARDFNPNDSGERPLIVPHVPAVESPRPPKNNKPRRKSKFTKNYTKQTMTTTKIEQIQVADPPPETKRAEQRAAHEPEPPSRERKYFWNQADIYRPGDRDVLPAVPESEKDPRAHEKPVGAADANPKTEAPEVFTLEAAVNPNDAAKINQPRVELPTKQDEKQPARQKTGFITRRRQKRAVQSQPMEGETYERPTQFQPYLQPAEAAKKNEDPPLRAEADLARGENAGITGAQVKAETTVADTKTESGPKDQIFEATIVQEKKFGRERETVTESAELALEQSEQLELAKNILLDGVSVNEMFQAKRIDEAGLRRIIAAYLRGGDLRDVIKSEIIRLQLRFERDPQLRDMPVHAVSAPTISGSRDKQRSTSLLDSNRNRDRSEKLAELTQSALERSHALFNDNPKAGRNLSIAAIVVIYLLILIVAITK